MIDFRRYEDAEVLAREAGATHMAYTASYTYYLRDYFKGSGVEIARLRVAEPFTPIEFGGYGSRWEAGGTKVVTIGHRAEDKALR